MVDAHRRASAVVVAVTAVVLGAVAWNAVVADRQGWTIEGDNAVVAVRAWDVFTSHPPLLGNPTTAGDGLHHPGPVASYLLAVPVRLLGPAGLLYGAAAITAAWIAVIAWLAHRRARWRGALAGLGLAAVLVWSVGSEIPHDAYNPHQAILPLAALAVAAWSVACRDPVALPVAVVAASVAAQLHVFYALTALPIAAAVAVAAGSVARPSRRAAAVAAALALVLWLPPVLAEVRGGPSNLAGLLRSDPGEGPPIGLGFAVARLTATVLEGAWLGRQPDPLRLVEEPAGSLQVLAVLALAALGWAGWRAHRRGRATAAALAATALLTAAAATVATARLPGGYPLFQSYSHRIWWVAGALTWFAAAWLAAAELRPRLPRLDGRVEAALLAAPAVVAAVAAAATVRIDEDRGSASFGAVDALAAAALGRAQRDGDGPWLVVADGPQAAFSVQHGIIAALVLRDVDVRVRAELQPAYGAHRGGGATERSFLVVSAGEPPPVPPGYDLVARFDAVADVTRRGRANVSIFGEAEHLALLARVPDP